MKFYYCKKGIHDHMGTSSRIGIIQADGTILSIYVHFDGYLDGVGYYLETLKTEEIMAFLEKGDRRSVHQDSADSFYDTPPEMDYSLAAFLSRGFKGGCDFFYVFSNEWLVYHPYEFGDTSKQYTFYSIEQAKKKQKEI
jgi:hypothetical protein